MLSAPLTFWRFINQFIIIIIIVVIVIIIVRDISVCTLLAHPVH